MKASGIFLALIGLVVAIGALFMDVTAETALPSYTPYGALPALPSSIVNLSKLQSQMLVFVGGWGACLAGLILAVGGWIGELINPPPPQTAEEQPLTVPNSLADRPVVVDPDVPAPDPAETARFDAERNAKEAREMLYLAGGFIIFSAIVIAIAMFR